MANSYHQIYIHSFFVVKYREAIIGKSWKDDMHRVIANLISESGCTSMIVNGVADHVHCLWGLIPSVPVSVIMQSTKARSSKWVNESRILKHRFEWQEGYGAFSYSKSQLENVFRYIKNQKKHHQVQTFRDEYIQMLHKFGVDYDERYIFQDPV